MTFAFKYEKVVRKKNPMVDVNPLKRGSGKIVDLQDRVDSLNKNAAWKKTVKAWRTQNKIVDLDRMPQVSMETLGSQVISEDIQRSLDEKWCANKIANPDMFDEALLQTIQCIKTSDGKFVSIDGQHTSSTIAGLIDAGLVPGHTDWREFKFPFQYIETDNLAFARRAFGILNGKGKKRQSQYQQLRNAVYIVRIDQDRTDAEEVALEAKVSAVESHNCFPVEEDSPLLKYPGTFSNISTFKTLSTDELNSACAWHDKYFHYEGVHVNLFFIYRDMCRGFKAAKIPMTAKLQEELAALVQSLFVNLSQFSESAKEAYSRWHEARYLYKGDWHDDAYACALLQLYVKFGGAEKVPAALLDRFDDLIDFFDEDLLAVAENV
jgi:hypothetical protein